MATAARPTPSRLHRLCLPATVLLAAACALLVHVAAAQPAAATTLEQVDRSVQAGHLDEARRQLGRVLQAHPDDAQAHYVDAELLARQGLFGPAQDELSAARRLAPGLPFARPDAVRALDLQLERLGSTHAAAPPPAPASDAGIPLSLLLAVAAGGLFAWALMRLARQTSVSTGVSKR
ncbi:tetratricopeptide (TPR) repeat protein [Rubrivivax gelatinosus]|nr:hypothetical protein [Rubrivivax gelatinosus]MBG6081586.1 tetratricopeptide (TPR) repeat protein [Rubrivivax gelatinosus]